MLLGCPAANITLSYTTCEQAISFAADLKLGHYMKIPPGDMFSVQVVAVVVTSIWSILVQDWMLDKIVDICSQLNPRDLFALIRIPLRLLYRLGSHRTASSLQARRSILWFFFLARYINVPLFFTGISAMPPASRVNYVSWILWGFILFIASTSAGGCDTITSSRLLSIQGMPSPFSQYSSH